MPLDTARLFIGLCLKKKRKKEKNRLAGGGCCAIQRCAPLTDWNIPHRQRIGLSSAGQLSLCSAKKKQPYFFFFFDNCSLLIN